MGKGHIKGVAGIAVLGQVAVAVPLDVFAKDIVNISKRTIQKLLIGYINHIPPCAPYSVYLKPSHNSFYNFRIVFIPHGFLLHIFGMRSSLRMKIHHNPAVIALTLRNPAYVSDGGIIIAGLGSAGVHAQDEDIALSGLSKCIPFVVVAQVNPSGWNTLTVMLIIAHGAEGIGINLHRLKCRIFFLQQVPYCRIGILGTSSQIIRMSRTHFIRLLHLGMSKDPRSQFVVVPRPFAQFIVLTGALIEFLERRKYSADFFHLFIVAGNIIMVNIAVSMIKFAVICIAIIGAHEAKSNARDEFRI